VTDLEHYRRTDRAQDVGFVFGALSAVQLPGPGLLRLLGHLHMTESAARSTLAKMVRLGRLDVERHGRVGVYSLGAPLARRYRQIEGTAEPPAWSGGFHGLLHHVPESARWFRDRLVYYAGFHGFGTLRPGVLISARPDAGTVLDQLGEVPAGAFVHRVRVTPESLEEARHMARTAWDLAGIARRAEDLTARIRAVRGSGEIESALGAGGEGLGPRGKPRPEPPADETRLWEAFRQWNALYEQVVRVVMIDPHLPAELLPQRWPVSTLFTELNGLNARWGPVLQPMLRAQVEQAAPGLARYEPSPWERA
jgi:DNA-binding transcriptional regulator PaaX